MSIQKQIQEYINSQSEAKKTELTALHKQILEALPGCKLWFLDGKNEEGKIVTNPNIGYGQYTIRYADGSTKDFYQIGLSANTTGISVYIMGLPNKTYLPETFGQKIGKASVTGYCIKFKKLQDIQVETLLEVIHYGFNETNKQVNK